MSRAFAEISCDSSSVPLLLPVLIRQGQGGPGSVRLRFGDRTVRAVPVFGSGG